MSPPATPSKTLGWATRSTQANPLCWGQVIVACVTITTLGTGHCVTSITLGHPLAPPAPCDVICVTCSHLNQDFVLGHQVYPSQSITLGTGDGVTSVTSCHHHPEDTPPCPLHPTSPGCPHVSPSVTHLLADGVDVGPRDLVRTRHILGTGGVKEMSPLSVTSPRLVPSLVSPPCPRAPPRHPRVGPSCPHGVPNVPWGHPIPIWSIDVPTGSLMSPLGL